MRRLLFSFFLVGILAALAFAGVRMLGSADNVSAAHTGGMDAMDIDMDPSTLPANTCVDPDGPIGGPVGPLAAVCVIGTQEVCASIVEDGVITADEDSIDRLEVDVTALNIPGTAPMIGFAYSLGLPPLSLWVASENQMFLLAAINGSTLLPGLSDTVGVPVATWTSVAVDSTTTSAESAATLPTATGTGVLSRLELETFPASVAGLFPLTLTGNAHVDLISGGGVPPHSTNGVVYPGVDVGALVKVAVNQPCPTPVDLKVMAVTATSPVTNPIGTFPVTSMTIVHNNGPDPIPAIADVSQTLALPPNCTALEPLTAVTTIPVMFTSTPYPVPAAWTVTCTEPSFHSFSVSSTIALNPLDVGHLDPVGGNNGPTPPGPGVSVTALTATSDLKIVSQALNGFPANKSASLAWPPLIDGGSLPFTADKIVHNNTPGYGPADALISSGGVIANLVGGLEVNDCTVAPPGYGIPVTLPVSFATPVSEAYSLTCVNDNTVGGIDGAAGMGEDSDGDGLIDEDGFAPGPASPALPLVTGPAPESFPLQCFGTVDEDGDGVPNDGCPAVDDDSDGSFNEDAGFLLPTVCISNSIGFNPTWQPFIDGHVSDPNPANNGALTCKTVLFELPFTPSFSVIQDNANFPDAWGFDGPFPAGAGSPPLSDDCLLTQPCEQLIEYALPNNQPLAGVITIIPGGANYSITPGPFIPNGDVVIRSAFNVNVNLGPGTPCTNPATNTGFDLYDGVIPLSGGEGPDSLIGDIPALWDPAKWPLRVESSALFKAFDPNGTATPGGLPVVARATALIPLLSIPANVVVFTSGVNYYQVLITGDPAAPVVSPAVSTQACTPLTVAADYLGELSATYLNVITGLPSIAPGLDLRTCNTIRGGSNPADFHYIVGQFQRTDTGQAVIIPDPNKCTADNDVAVTKSDDLTVDAPINLTHTETINLIVSNGAVPGPVTVTLSLVGPAVCNPLLVNLPGDGNTSPDVPAGPTVVAGQQSTILTWTELNMGAGEPRPTSRDYTVNCPAGSYTLQVVVNASSPFPDQNTANNQAENHPVVTAANNDIDNDTILNGSDNCPTIANTNQANADGDALGDVCDDDDDNDLNPDVTDNCDTAAEDIDTIDDADGCPDTDSAIKYVVKSASFNVDVSTTNAKNVKVGVQNQGNIVASLEVTLLIRSQVNVCEAHWVPQPGDGVVNDNIGGVIHSQLTVILPAMLPGETREINRNYTVHCFTKSFHDNAIRFEVGVAPVFPVAEESDDVLDNVYKQNIDITAYNVSDVKKLGIFVLDPPMVVGVPITVPVRSVFHNNGPYGPTDVIDTISVVAPNDCTAVGIDSLTLGHQNPFTAVTTITLPVSVTVTLDQDFELTCNEPSFHEFTWYDSITVSELHVRDPNLGNNSATTIIVNPVTTTADPKITSVVVTAPATIAVDTNFDVTVDAQAANGGPFGPVSAIVTVSLSVPSDCTKVPNGPISSLPMSVGSPPLFSPVWLVNCSSASNHQFDATATITATLPLHVTDSNTENNVGLDSAITAVTKTQDKDITGASAQQEPIHVDLEAPALVEDRRAANPGDANGPNGDSANVTAVPAVPAVSYEFFARIATLAVTNTSVYNLNVTPSTGGCTALSAAANYPEAAELLGTVNVVKAPVNATLPSSVAPCTLTITSTLSTSALHNTDGDTDVAVVTVVLCPDVDDDGVSTTGGVCGNDNCPTVPNPGQEDSDNDLIGDACDDTPFHNDGVKYCLKFGPAPINLSDNGGAYMWVLCEIGNFSGHDDLVTITAANAILTASLPDGCTATSVLLIPGRTDFVLLAGEQKFVLYRTKFECHAPAIQQVLPITVTVSINHVQEPPDGDDLITSNDSVSISQNIIVGPPPPP